MRRVDARGEAARLLSLLALIGTISGCGYNEVITRDEEVKAAWAEVQNQYKRRADLIPNLVRVVRGSAEFEQDTLQKVVDARARVGSMQVDPSIIDDPERLQQFEAAQQQLGSALNRLMVVVERYPQLQASAAFRDLQAQIEGTENRIAVARQRYIEAVALYNQTVLHFPTSIGAKMRGKMVRPTFEGNPAEEAPPEVQF
jgi:LemA protein